MRFSSALGLLTTLAASALAEDLLFLDTLKYSEYSEAIALGFTAKVVTDVQWRAMTTSDFTNFKAIIISDPNGSPNLAMVKTIEDTKAVWSPAVTGNMILIGGDPSNHFSTPGAKTLIDNAVKFAAAGGSTGFYWSLSQYYDSKPTSTVTPLSYFGNIEVRGSLNCYDDSHIVASSPALGTLTDAALSNWGCSVHEAFSVYPQTGLGGFQALAIAKGVIGVGSQTFGDGSIGLPYIISRGATPSGCGDGKWDSALFEECDDGNTVNGDGCSASCKCESGRPDGKGKCLPSSSVSGTPVIYSNSTVTVSSVTTATVQVPVIVGVEIIIYITIIETHNTINGLIVTSYVTSTCSTMQNPIYNVPTPGYPCYVCQLSSQGIPCPTGSFITATTTLCPSCPGGVLPTPVLPVVQACHTCSAVTLSVAPTCSYITDYIVSVPTPSSHPAHDVHTLITTSIYRTPTFTPVKPTTPVQFTGGAALATGIPVAGGALMAALMLI